LALLPGLARRSAASGTLPVERRNLLWNIELLVLRQTEKRLGEAHLLSTKGVPVRLLGVGEMRRGPADVAAEHQQRRAVHFDDAATQASLEGVQVVRHLAQAFHVPPVGLEALHDVV
jgi:hypothetical protein